MHQAFETVRNEILEKLSFYGVVKTALSWFCDYVLLFNASVGVPQGSALEPLMFLV